MPFSYELGCLVMESKDSVHSSACWFYFFLSSLLERLLQPTSTCARSKLNTLHGPWAQSTWAPIKTCSQMVV